MFFDASACSVGKDGVDGRVALEPLETLCLRMQVLAALECALERRKESAETQEHVSETMEVDNDKRLGGYGLCSVCGERLGGANFSGSSFCARQEVQ